MAAHHVAGFLRQALGTRRCGMIFEGFEIDYARVKLIPIHESPAVQDPVMTVAPFHEAYQGYVTSLSGPLVEDVESLARATLDIRGMYRLEPARPLRSWTSPSRHLSSVLQDPWYENLFLA